MAGNIQNVSFSSPQALLAPDLIAEQTRIQRQQEFAQALRQQGMQDIPANGGAISWTQGLAKILNAYVGGRMQRKADDAQAGLSKQYAAQIRGMFGGAGTTPAAPGAGSQPMAGAPNVAAANAGSPNYGSGGVDDDGTLTPPSSPMGSPASAGAPAAAPSAPSASPQAGPLSLSGDANTDMSLYMLDPSEYMKGVVASHAPTDLAKTIQQAQAAAARGDYATASALYGNVQKQNYIAPINGRPGSIIRDPNDPSKVLAIDPQNIEGANPTIGPNGQWTGGYTAAPGAAEIAGDMAAAKARGGAAGSVSQVYDPVSNSMVYRPTSSLLPGGPGSGGSLNSMFGAPAGGGAAPGGAGGGFAAAPPIGAAPAANTAGTNSANAFNGIIGGAQGSQDRALTIQKIADATKNLPTGAGALAINELKGGVNSALGAVGIGPAFDNSQIAKFQEAQKLASQLAQQQAASLGGAGATDAKLSAAFASLPDASKAPQAIAEITGYLQGNERAIQGKAQAAAAWQQAHGADSFPAFSSAWQKAYDPRIYQWMAQGPGAVQKGLAGLHPAERNALIAKSNQLHALGAL